MRKTSSTQSLPQKPEEVRLTIEVPDKQLHTSTSMTSLNVKFKRNIKRIRHNQCVGVIVLLTLGALFNGLAYMMSVYSAELNAELIESVVAKHEQSLNYKIKKAVSGAPSKYLVGLLNFAGQDIQCYWHLNVGSNDMLAEQLHDGGGVSEAVGECFTGCAGFF
ncbi:hypothetical protein M3Y97_00672200 [Aphelenchoides bicaudatus]|nr:hypothetical protein M3Y97_00672200 [Aphelenchoides bicaudatus]